MNDRPELSKFLTKSNYKTETSHSQPPENRSNRGMNLVKVSSEDQQKLITILKSHTAQTNSVSPRRSGNGTLKASMTPKGPAQASKIKSTIDAQRFFTAHKTPEDSLQNSNLPNFATQPSNDSTENLSDVDKKALEININPGDERNKQLLEFIRTVKEKFSTMEEDLEKTKVEMLYYKRKSEEQKEVVDELRKKER